MYTPNETIRNEVAIRDAALGAMREGYPELEGLLFPFRVTVAARVEAEARHVGTEHVQAGRGQHRQAGDGRDERGGLGR